jgi:hypothetical protein
LTIFTCVLAGKAWVDDELVEVRIAPGEGDLDSGVQLGDGGRISHQ